LCRVEEGTVGVSSLSGISKRIPYRCGLLDWLSLDWHLFSASPDQHFLALSQGTYKGQSASALTSARLTP